MEESEREDWGILTADDYETCKRKAVEATFLHRWIDRITPFTFATRVYHPSDSDGWRSALAACPETLPFPKCMVRLSNRSPKDSPHWGPAGTKADVERMLSTSLRCQRGASSILCLREWVVLGKEARVFWNHGAVAISCDFEKERVESMMNYLQGKIPFRRCVIDVAETVSGWVIIEINSWEVNSGAFNFSWNETDIFYPEHHDTVATVRTTDAGFVKEYAIPSPSYFPRSTHTRFYTLPDGMTILAPTAPSCWLMFRGDVYICNDKYLARFDERLDRKCFVTGDFRFAALVARDEYTLSIGKSVFHYDLSRTTRTAKAVNLARDGDWWYGFRAEFNGAIVFVRFHYDGLFEIV